ncbi:MAG: hypothetical protein NUV32_06040 [Exilispira sp.]|jgi:hypothetical protein|nr:hypothetical protein [Exilispira sp.]
MKNLKLIMFFEFFIIFLLASGCINTFTNNISFDINYIAASFNSNGYAEVDLTYTYQIEGDYFTESFFSNGEYKYEVHSYENTGEDKDYDSITGEGWVLINGTKGDYKYDLDNFLLTINYSQVFGNDPSTPDGKYIWYDIITNESDPYFDPDKVIKESYNCILFQHTMTDDVFLYKSEHVYTKVLNEYYADDRIMNETITYDFNVINAIEMTKIDYYKDKNDNILSGEKMTVVLDIYKCYPTEAIFYNGDTISFYYQSANYKYYNWSNNAWVFNHETIEKYYMCLGTFVTSKDRSVIFIIDENYYRNK